jgi:hypothetical protein
MWKALLIGAAAVMWKAFDTGAVAAASALCMSQVPASVSVAAAALVAFAVLAAHG